MRVTTREAIRQLRKDHPKTWGKFSEANLLRRYYEAKKRMSTLVPMIWHQITAQDIGKKCMLPTNRYSSLADQSYTSGHVYRMIVGEEAERRTSEQNRKMWPLLTEFSQQVEHYGHHWSPEDWKSILMHAFGKEIRLLPGLDGSVVPVGLSTSVLLKSEFIKFIEFIIAEGTQRGVIFSHEPPPIDTQSASTVHLRDQTAANRRAGEK